ncbi:LysR family transcriptional regulator [Pseudomonas floridensis]|uniref:LysR family transcriptional regulator n=1 Tax=Pseudomonas floridensis TaxID=1958950 RepID=A0A1X0N7D3_9PSED|nr:LysR substrate-binding domain-containing protein [Pseudomonas floridensis]ORC58818.1 LysR family transcriptional regulator [Pseudomonas floridensis]
MTERIPPLYALRAFEVAARSCSFTRAAQELSLTQSAISRHIRTLEETLGCRLFERNGPRLSLSDEGRRLASQLKIGFRIIEDACQPFRGKGTHLRLKAPSTLTMRWLLHALDAYQNPTPTLPVQLSSVWMDFDSVDLYSEPYDCAILLGNGNFGADVETCKLFDEWLIPICSAETLGDRPWEPERLRNADLIHPSTDRRDWRRWLKRMNLSELVSLDTGKVFDTLDQGITAAVRGHGVSIGDLFLIANEVHDGQVVLPFDSAVGTGDAYYLVWLQDSFKRQRVLELREHLLSCLPDISGIDVNLLASS